MTAHEYLSTGCLHGEHAYCQAKTGTVGTKRPAECKSCAAPCTCDCHQRPKNKTGSRSLSPLEQARRTIANLREQHARRSSNGVHPANQWTAEQRILALRRLADTNLQRALRAERSGFLAAARAVDAEQRAWAAGQRLAQYEGGQQ